MPNGTNYDYSIDGISSVPWVIGVFAIIFAIIGMLMNSGLALDMGFAMSDLGLFGTWMTYQLIPALVVSTCHLAGGILAVLYHRRAPLVLTIYAVLALVLNVAEIAISVITLPGGSSNPAFDMVAMPRIEMMVIATLWPVVVLALINLRRSRQSCYRSPGGTGLAVD